MAKLPETFNIGNREDLTPENILKLIERLYIDLARAINQKPDLVVRPSDGQTTDSFLSPGTININSSTLKIEQLSKHVNSSTVIWTQLSP